MFVYEFVGREYRIVLNVCVFVYMLITVIPLEPLPPKLCHSPPPCASSYKRCVLTPLHARERTLKSFQVPNYDYQELVYTYAVAWNGESGKQRSNMSRRTRHRGRRRNGEI